jgi:tetratricopeptide (TPR) repeat protein
VQLLLAAAALDPKLTEPYTELIDLTGGNDDEAALKYAKKALDIRPAEVAWQLTYVRSLWPVDQDAARRYYAQLLKKHAGSKDGAATIQQFIGAVEDPAEKAALVERFRREYPNDWTPSYFANSDLFGTWVSVDPQKGLDLAREILTAVENPKPGADGKPAPPEAYLKTMWTRNVGYAQAVVDARALMATGKGAEALARLEKQTTPSAVDDEAQLDVLRAEATATSGDVAKAYDMLVASLAADINQSTQKAIVSVGAKLGKSPKQIDDEVWARRMQKAETFADFKLAKLGSQERVKLADLRGKVVLVDFWFPG